MLELSVANIKMCCTLETLLGIEGNNAKVYFSRVGIMIRNKEFIFNGRSKHPSKDNTNALLSYLYVILNNEIVNALRIVGLDSQCGFMHTDISGRDSLAWDMQEKLRVFLVDKLVLKLINKHIIKKDDFNYTDDKVLLNSNGKVKVIKAWNELKEEKIEHKSFMTKNTSTKGMLPYFQALLIARHIRSDGKEKYISFKDWK